MLITQQPPLTWLQRERAWVEIDRAALQHNVRQLKHWVGDRVELMAVIKADAYGHGAVTVAQSVLAAGAEWLAVATIEEGGQLREANITAPILVLGAAHTPDQIKALLHWQLQPTLCTMQQAFAFAEVLQSLGRSLPVHLNIDTGMARLGTRWTEAATWAQWVARSPVLQLSSLYSHFATADDPDPTVMQLQHQRFQVVLQQVRSHGLPLPKLHMANSAGILSDRAYHFDRVRAGLALYGLAPAPHLADRLPLRPVLSVKARITQVKAIEPGEGVSYGYRYVADRPTRVAVVGIGYADGVPRNLSNQMQVLIRGRRVRQIGSITMDQLMLDVTDLPEDLMPGEVVTLLGTDGGDQIRAEDWADQLGTISWEILCSFKHRLPRVSVN
ncbi:MAG: alanine racemase [Oscillatoriales cyanobacterium]|nr:MAG: alanine racemase [Oscillatoriales cyanobacterium]